VAKALTQPWEETPVKGQLVCVKLYESRRCYVPVATVFDSIAQRFEAAQELVRRADSRTERAGSCKTEQHTVA
jgi:hypothetical protein